MRNLSDRNINRYRDYSPSVARLYGNYGDETCGVFQVPSPIDSAHLKVIAACGGDWDHLSVSRNNRCPNWPELEHVRKLFFNEDETVMQLHVPASEHINLHPHCLHLWRPQKEAIPRPPAWMVGP